MSIAGAITTPDGRTYTRSLGRVWIPGPSLADKKNGKVPCEVCGQPAVKVATRLIDVTVQGDQYRSYELASDCHYFCHEHFASRNPDEFTTLYAGDYGPEA